MAILGTRKSYEARDVSARLSPDGAVVSFHTPEGEDLVVAMDRTTLARLQRYLARALAPVGNSSEQP